MIRLINAAGTTKDLPLTMSWRQVPLSWTTPLIKITGGASVLTGVRSIDSRQFTLSGSLYNPDKAQIVSDADDLLHFLQQVPINVYRDSASERHLVAYPLGAPQDWLDGGAELVLNVTMVAPEPLFQGDEVDRTENVTAIGQTETIVVGGTAPTKPVITITVNQACSDIEIEQIDTNEILGLSGDYSAGDVITVDCEHMTVLLNGQPAMDRPTAEWLLGGLALRPGNNPLRFRTAAEPTDMTAVFTWRPKWY